MKIILPMLPKTVYLVDLKAIRWRVTSFFPSYPSYPSYLSFFVHFSLKKLVDNSAILSTPPDPCIKKYFSRFRGFLGKNPKKVRCILQCYPSPNSLIHRDKLTV
jgi:hypothetical protein